MITMMTPQIIQHGVAIIGQIMVALETHALARSLIILTPTVYIITHSRTLMAGKKNILVRRVDKGVWPLIYTAPSSSLPASPPHARYIPPPTSPSLSFPLRIHTPLRFAPCISGRA